MTVDPETRKAYWAIVGAALSLRIRFNRIDHWLFDVVQPDWVEAARHRKKSS